VTATAAAAATSATEEAGVGRAHKLLWFALLFDLYLRAHTP